MAKKWPKIANNCKISEITKYGEKITNNDKNLHKCTQMTKNIQKRPNGHHFSGSKLAQQIDTVS